MGLEKDVSIKNLVILTVYNWQLTDVMDSLAFSTASYIWNSFRHADNSRKSSAIHYYLL